MRRFMAAAAAAATLMACLGANAQAVDQKKFNVVGTWNFLTNWKELEVPFWDQGAAGCVGRQTSANIKSDHRTEPQGY